MLAPAGEYVRTPTPDIGGAAGAGIEEGGQHLLQAVNIHGQIAADHATNNWMTQTNKVYYGDPEQGYAQGDDGKPVTTLNGDQVFKGGLYALKGQDFLNAQRDASRQIDTITQQERANLPTAMSRMQFDRDTRRMRYQADAEMGRHAIAAQEVWGVSQAQNIRTNALTMLAANPTDPGVQNESMHRFLDSAEKVAYWKGEDKDTADEAAKQDWARSATDALRGDHPQEALQFAQAHRDILLSTPEGTRLYDQVIAGRGAQFIAQRTQAYAQSGAGAGGAGAVDTGPGTAAGFAAPKGATFDQIGATSTDLGGNAEETAYLQHAALRESGGDPNAKNKKGTRFGVFQYPTQGSVEAQTKQAFTDMKANEQSLSAAGIRPTSANLYTLHQQGPAGGMALLKADPGANAVDILTPAYKGNRALAEQAVVNNGGSKDMTAGEFLGHIRNFWARGGGGGGGGAVGGGGGGGGDAGLHAYADKAADDFAAEVGPGHEDDVERVRKGVYENTHRDNSEQAAGLEQAAENSVDFLHNGGDPKLVTVTGPQLRAGIGGARGEAAAEKLESAQQYATAAASIKTAPQSQIDALLSEENKPTSVQGEMYAGPERRALQAAALQRNEAIYGNREHVGDGAGYLVKNFPDVADAAKALFNNPNPTQAQWQTYLSKLNSAYDLMQIAPGDARRVLPANIATDMVAHVQDQSPEKGFAALTMFHREAGDDNWGLITRDLVQHGLPGKFQTALIVGARSQRDANTMVAAMQYDQDLHLKGQSMEEQATSQAFGQVPVKSLINQALDMSKAGTPSARKLQLLRQSFTEAGGIAGLDTFTDVQTAIRETALYLTLTKKASTPQLAADQAIKMVTDSYDFMTQPGQPPTRVPAGSLGAFKIASNYMKSQLTPDRMAAPSGMTGAQATAYRQDALGFARNGYWLTVASPNAKGTARLIGSDGHEVRLNDGNYMDLDFDKLGPRVAAAGGR